MKAYAALVSLMNVVDNIQNHPPVSTFFYEKQIQSLCEKLDFLVDFVESHASYGGIREEEVEDLENHIESAAQEAEDVIESHIVDQILHDHRETSSSLRRKRKALKEKFKTVKEKIRSKAFLARYTRKSPTFLLDLQKILKEMDSIKEKVVEVEKKRGLRDQQPKSAIPAALTRPLTTGKTTMVGFDSYLVQLLDWLTAGQRSDRRMIPITGMGGSGKTTLARAVYENSHIVRHFDVKAWATISHEYDVRKILSELIVCLTNSTSEKEETENQLGERLHKFLFGRRYLIILDDVWTFEAWNKIKFFFPQNDNTSRIVVTTRQLDVAKHCGSLALAVYFLDDDRSWDLFCERAFVEEGCPSELEEIGKKIVKKCKGLPLAIVLIGGLFRKSPMTPEYWENVEKDLSSILNSVDNNRCLNILSLSVSHLPVCLKPCFLYLGIYPEDHEIRVSRLIKLWVAEGFLKPNTEQNLEDVAKGYIKDLIDRNLLLVHKLGWKGNVKTCSIHDLLRDLCKKIAEKEKFFFVMSKLESPRDIDRERRIIILKNDLIPTWLSASVARSATGFGRCRFHNSRLLRVMSGASNTLDNTFQEVNLRFVEDNSYATCNRSPMPSYIIKFSSKMSLLWNLQTLILTMDQHIEAPSEIWEMTQLRHIDSFSIFLPDPPQSDKQDCIAMQNLQTLRRIHNFKCSEEVCKRMPNIRKLHIIFRGAIQEIQAISYYCHKNLVCLNKLESLEYDLYNVPNRDDLLQNLRFPSSLKKLTLKNANLQWNDLTIIGWLPNLEVLHLRSSVEGPDWNPVEGGFCCLKFLKIYSCNDLISWNVDKSHFPVLEKLHLVGLRSLEEIPSAIDTLEDICLLECSVSAAISAMKILEEQECLGNEDLQVRVHFWEKTKADEFKLQVEQEGLCFTRPNFQLYYGLKF